MKISIFGLGYVGCVSAACLAKEGHEVIGVDIQDAKVASLNKGQSPIVEKGLHELLQELQSTNSPHSGSLLATTDGYRAVQDTDLSLLCVGTPSKDNGSLNLDYVRRSCRDIGAGLKTKTGYHVVVVRSTMLPGSIESQVIPELEYTSGKKAARDFGVAMNPEFLREGSSIHDFYHPPFIVVGALDEPSSRYLRDMYAFLDCPVEVTDIKTAEMLKYACNSFHGLKVAFANEIGAVCKSLGIDSHRVMDLFCKDTQLNISPYYLKPGFAFGGSCLPKDLRAMNYLAKHTDVQTPLLNSILDSNQTHINRTFNSILRQGKKRIGLLGLSFKPDTDDLRESPLVILTENLIGKGFDIRIYDQNVSLAGLLGTNKEYIEKEIPHISSLMLDNIQDVLEHAEVVVVGNKSEEFRQALNGNHDSKTVIDLVRLQDELSPDLSNYQGICW